MSLPYAMFETLRAPDALSDVTAFNDLDEIPLAVEAGSTHPASAAFVANNYFAMLGVRPSLGRGFLPDAVNEVVVSDRTWRSVLHADRLALGRPLRIGTGVFTPAAQAGIVIAEDSGSGGLASSPGSRRELPTGLPPSR